MELRYRAPKGMSDIVFPDSWRWERFFRMTAEIFELYGYRPISTPVLESTDLFRRSIGEETDIVTKEMFTFEDQGGESLTLRPEGTAPVVRAYLEQGLFSLGQPQKLYYIGPMFRRERPQAGRFRQFHQVSAEAIGSGDAFLDAELIAVSDLILKRLGLKQYRLIVNSIGCADCRPGYVERLSAFLEGVASQLCERCVKRKETNPLRVLDCKNEKCVVALKEAPAIRENLCAACSGHFDQVLAHLDRLGIAFVIDDRLVRGLDYYTKTTFEFQFEGLGAQNAVSGGGRYDYLAEQLGGPPTPGVGFSLGVERLMMSLEAEGLDPFEPHRLDAFVACIEDVYRRQGLELLSDLRGAGLSADADFMGRSLKAQMKQADRLSARFVVIVGGEEAESGEAVLRDLDRSEQSTVSTADIVEFIKAAREGGR